MRLRVAINEFLTTSNGDGVLITGDISGGGTRHSLKHAREVLFDGIGASGMPLIPRGFKEKVLLLPGNYDRYQQLVPPKYLSPHFNEVFASEWTKDLNELVISKVYDCDNGSSIAIVAADLCVQRGNSTVMTQAEFSNKIKSDLIRATRDFQTENIPTVWAMHFAPRRGDVPSHMQIDNEHQLIELARDLKVPAIFCGHIGNPSIVSEDGVTVYCAGTACCEPGVHSTEHSNYINGPHYQEVEIQLEGNEMRFDTKHFMSFKSDKTSRRSPNFVRIDPSKDIMMLV